MEKQYEGVDLSVFEMLDKYKPCQKRHDAEYVEKLRDQLRAGGVDETVIENICDSCAKGVDTWTCLRGPKCERCAYTYATADCVCAIRQDGTLPELSLIHI